MVGIFEFCLLINGTIRFLILLFQGHFSMLVYWVCVLFRTPFHIDFLIQKIIVFHSYRILAWFWGMLQIFSIILTILSIFSPKMSKNYNFYKTWLTRMLYTSKKAKIFLGKKRIFPKIGRLDIFCGKVLKNLIPLGIVTVFNLKTYPQLKIIFPSKNKGSRFTIGYI